MLIKSSKLCGEYWIFNDTLNDSNKGWINYNIAKICVVHEKNKRNRISRDEYSKSVLVQERQMWSIVGKNYNLHQPFYFEKDNEKYCYCYFLAGVNRSKVLLTSYRAAYRVWIVKIPISCRTSNFTGCCQWFNQHYDRWIYRETVFKVL